MPEEPINIEPRNECAVITIFPMGATCNVINPTNTETFDGVASLEITGGTPPYSISWDNKNYSSTITSIGVGEYNATITDFYNDFTIVTTCVLTAETPTSTTTTSTTTLPVFGDLCAIVSPSAPDSPTIFYDFEYNGYINGKPSWQYNDSELVMYWNTGTTDLWVINDTSGMLGNNTIATNLNPDSPPLSGWELLGSKDTITVIEGSCDEIQPLALQISVTDPQCAKVDNGSIIVQAYGGVPPYEYSIDAGVTYQLDTTFTNLAAGSYFVVLKDSLGITQGQLVTLNATTQPVTYSVLLDKDNNNGTFQVTVTPALPAGVTLTFDIIYQSEFFRTPEYPPIGPYTYNGDLNVLVDGLPFTQDSPTIINTQTQNDRCPDSKGDFTYLNFTTNTDRTWSNITMTNGTIVNGTVIDELTLIAPPNLECLDGNRTFNYSIDNLEIQGCDPCCSARVIAPLTNQAFENRT